MVSAIGPIAIARAMGSIFSYALRHYPVAFVLPPPGAGPSATELKLTPFEGLTLMRFSPFTDFNARFFSVHFLNLIAKVSAAATLLTLSKTSLLDFIPTRIKTSQLAESIFAQIPGIRFLPSYRTLILTTAILPFLNLFLDASNRWYFSNKNKPITAMRNTTDTFSFCITMVGFAGLTLVSLKNIANWKQGAAMTLSYFGLLFPKYEFTRQFTRKLPFNHEVPMAFLNLGVTCFVGKLIPSLSWLPQVQALVLTTIFSVDQCVTSFQELNKRRQKPR